MTIAQTVDCDALRLVTRSKVTSTDMDDSGSVSRYNKFSAFGTTSLSSRGPTQFLELFPGGIRGKMAGAGNLLLIYVEG